MNADRDADEDAGRHAGKARPAGVGRAAGCDGQGGQAGMARARGYSRRGTDEGTEQVRAIRGWRDGKAGKDMTGRAVGRCVSPDAVR